MDWENEPWIKLYTRDSGDKLIIEWEGRALLHELLCKVDRAGVLDMTDPRLIAAACRMPTDVVVRVLPRLEEQGIIERRGRFLILPNFVEAQEARKSDALRQREMRARRRAMARLGEVTKHGNGVTNPGQIVTNSNGGDADPFANVTPSHTASQRVPIRLDKTRTENSTLSETPSGVPTAVGLEEPDRQNAEQGTNPEQRNSAHTSKHALANPEQRNSRPSQLALNQEPSPPKPPLPARPKARKKKPPPSAEGLKLADYLRSQLLEADPGHSVGRGKWGTSAKRKNWGREFDRMVAQGRSPRRAAELMRWVAQGCPGFKFEFAVECPKTLDAKWERIDRTERGVTQPRRESPPKLQGKL